MQTINECHVVANDVGHRRKEVARLNHHVDWLVGVAEHGDARVARDSLLASLKCARLAVGLHRCDDLFGHLLEVRNLVKPNDVPDLDHPLLSTRHVTEEIRDLVPPVRRAE